MKGTVGVWSLPLLFASWLPYCEQFYSTTYRIPGMRFCLATGPKAIGPSNHELKPLAKNKTFYILS
jgi:hypothetical protein